MKTDINDRADIEKLVDAFYEKIKADEEISFFFNEVHKVKWEEHLPKIYNFFENILFSTGDYDLNPMLKHKEVSSISEINTTHFAKWNVLFDETINELFEGEKAEEIKQRTKNIAAVIGHK